MGAEMATVTGDCLATVSVRTAGHGSMGEEKWVGLATGSCMGLWTSGAGKREICCWRWRQCTRRRSRWYLLTLSRTSVPGRVQPGDVTREHFLVLVREAYAAVFPAPDVLHEGPTFAYVVRELHHNHPLLHLREPHLHLAGEWGRGRCLCSGEVPGASCEGVCMIQFGVPISTQTPGRLRLGGEKFPAPRALSA